MCSVPIASSPTERERVRQQPLIGGKHEIDAIVEIVRQGKCCRLIGTRYHHKSQIMQAACRTIEEQLGYRALYLSLYDARTLSLPAFCASLQDWIALKAQRYHKLRLQKLPIRAPSDLATWLGGLPDQFQSPTVIFIDDLEWDAVPPNYLQELLRILRSAYQTTVTREPLLAVIGATNSLARTALGPTSPFENISTLVSIRDLSHDETTSLGQSLMAEQCPNPTSSALNLIHQATAGDRFLASELCNECCRVARQQGNRRITPRLVQHAMTNLVTRDEQGALAEELAHIESNPDLLRVTLDLMERGQLTASELPFDPAEKPDPLTASGFVARTDNVFRFKSALHRRLLKHTLTAERVGQIFLAAGDWDRALTYLQRGVKNGAHPAAARQRVMQATINAMYSTPNQHEAYAYLARGLTMAYPRAEFHIYDLDEKTATLRLAYPEETGRRSKKIPVRAIAPLDPYALDKQDYWWQRQGQIPLAFFFPLRANNQGMGLVIVNHWLTRRALHQRQEDVFELVGYLNHAARALKNRLEYENILATARHRAQELRNLLELTHQFMGASANHQHLLDHALKSALHELAHQAQMGSIYLYDRRTGLVTLCADTGYAEAVKQAARFKPGKGIAGIVYSTGKSIIVNEAVTDSRYAVLPAEPPSVQATIGVPLLGKQGPIGVLCLDNIERSNVFNADSERLLQLFANQITLWLENVRLVEILAGFNQTTIALRDLSSSDPQELLDKLANQIMHHFEMNSCVIGLCHNHHIRFSVRHGVTLPAELALADLPTKLRLVVENNKPLVLHHLKNRRDDLAAWLGRPELNSLVAVPLVEESQERGLLLLACVGKFSSSNEELKLLQTFANQAVIARHNADMYRETRGELARRVQELEKANAELEVARRREAHYNNARMATGLLHRIKNSVMIIPDLVDELEQARELNKMTAPLRELRMNVNTLSEINHWLQQFARVGKPDFKRTDIAALVTRTLQKLETRRPTHVQIEGPPNIDTLTIRADEMLMDLLIENLIKNAWEAIPTQRDGRVQIQIQQQGAFCEIRACDNGSGIAPENWDKIWEWGWSTKQAATSSDRGLGLFVCHDIVDVHHGTIRVEQSALNHGTTILVRLPMHGPNAGE